jgi:hypothetical protein
MPKLFSKENIKKVVQRKLLQNLVGLLAPPGKKQKTAHLFRKLFLVFQNWTFFFCPFFFFNIKF